MATEREINEAVARKLADASGLVNIETQKAIGTYVAPSYSTSIAEAWEIVEHLKKTENCGLQLNSDDLSATCWLGTRHMQKQFADAKTLPMAICLAFLKLEDSNE